MPSHLALAVLLAARPAFAEPISPPGRVVVHLDGMVCKGCQDNVAATLDGLPFLEGTVASFAVGGACATLSAPGDTERIGQAIAGLGYSLTSVEVVQSCPPKLRRGHRVDPWDDTGGHDVQVISRGEEVDLQAHLAAGKHTVVDFGAPWCGPCHTAAAALREHMSTHDDVAVRAVSLEADDPHASFALPVAAQHLEWVSGIPYFLVFDAAGRSLYKGADVAAAIRAIDKHRSRR